MLPWLTVWEELVEVVDGCWVSVCLGVAVACGLSLERTACALFRAAIKRVLRAARTAAPSCNLFATQVRATFWSWYFLSWYLTARDNLVAAALTRWTALARRGTASRSFSGLFSWEYLAMALCLTLLEAFLPTLKLRDQLEGRGKNEDHTDCIHCLVRSTYTTVAKGAFDSVSDFSWDRASTQEAH